MPKPGAMGRLERMERAFGGEQQGPQLDPLSLCAFPEQRAFVLDAARLLAGFCTRRSAKSYTAGIKMFRAALNYPRSYVLYAAITRADAKRIIWLPVLKELDERLKTNCTFNESELTVTFPNGSVIYVAGADANEKERRKFKGAKFRLVIIDESQDFATDQDDFVYGVLKPATAELKGQICMLGTPGNLTRGLYYEITNGKKPGWKVHTWTAFQNQAIPWGETEPVCVRWKREIEELLRIDPLIAETNAFQQNYLGKWVIDDDAKIYKWKDDLYYDELPSAAKLDPQLWHRQLGIDLGYEDSTAFVVCAYHDHSPILWIPRAYKLKHLDFTSVAQHVRKLETEFRLEGPHIVDGANKQGVIEMINRHELDLRSADKTAKQDHIMLMNDDMIRRRIRVHRTEAEQLAQEWRTCLRKFKKDGSWDEDPRTHPDLADAALYAWRACSPYIDASLPMTQDEALARLNKRLMDPRRGQQEELEYQDKIERDIMAQRESERAGQDLFDPESCSSFFNDPFETSRPFGVDEGW